MLQTRLRALRERASGDDGFSLAEAVVASLVLMLFASGVYGVLASTLSVTKVDRQRVAASNLAQREVEIARGIVARPAVGGSYTAALQLVAAGTVVNPSSLTPSSVSPSPAGSNAGPSVVDGVPYTITRSARWAVRGTGVSACDGGAAVSYPNIAVSVTVTWPGMGAVRPVVTDTVIAPPKGVLSSTQSFVAFRVDTFANVPNAGRVVTATGPSSQVQTTDSSGCALFGLSTPGAYTFTLNEPGYVASNGSQVYSVPRNVTAGTFTALGPYRYDRTAALTVDVAAPSGYALPQTAVDAAVYNSANLSTRSVATSASTGTFSALPPWTDGWVVYGGSCVDANPTLTPTSGARPRSILAPGSSSRVTALLAPVRVQHTGGLAGLTATAVNQATSPVCAAAQRTLVLGTTGAGGVLDTSLPYGSWRISLSNGSTSAVFNPPASGALTTVALP